MTHTIMNEQDNERKVYYLKELKRFGMTDEELRWMYENLTLSMISNIHSYPNRCIRFEYWFNVIKDVNVASDVLTVTAEEELVPATWKAPFSSLVKETEPAGL